MSRLGPPGRGDPTLAWEQQAGQCGWNSDQWEEGRSGVGGLLIGVSRAGVGTVASPGNPVGAMEGFCAVTVIWLVHHGGHPSGHMEGGPLEDACRGARGRL